MLFSLFRSPINLFVSWGWPEKDNGCCEEAQKNSGGIPILKSLFLFMAGKGINDFMSLIGQKSIG